MKVRELFELLKDVNPDSHICMVSNYDDIKQSNFDDIEAVIIERCIDDETKIPLEWVYLTASDT